MNGWQTSSEKNSWNSFLTNAINSSFLQSFEFGAFYTSLGKKIWRLSFEEQGIKGVCLLVKETTKLGNFLYSPGGPVLEDESTLEELNSIVTQIAREEKSSFVRFDPRVLKGKQDEKFRKMGFKRIGNFTQPKCSQILDLTKSLEEIRKGFSESTRYNVGWVERKGVRVEVSENPKDLEIFQKLLKETASRQNFRLHGAKDYYKKQFEAFADSRLAKLYLAKEAQNEGEEVLAASVVINFGKTTTYLHSASSAKKPKLRAPYLMQWKIIQDAKNAGYELYDFWGVAASDNPSDPWAGVTNFKKSFGGEKVCYESPFDLPLNQKYYLEKILEKTRLMVRKWL